MGALLLTVWREGSVLTIKRFALAALIGLFPYAYAIGTNGDTWSLSSKAGIFWVASAILLIAPLFRPQSRTAIIGCAVLFPFAISVMILAIGMEYPYRQPRLRSNSFLVSLQDRKSDLTVSAEFGHYISSLQALATQGGFRPGDPLIDLTGHYPAASVILARAVGLPWMIGGYPGSEIVVSSALERMPCDLLAAAWILTEPNGPRALSEDVVANDGTHYEAVPGSRVSSTGSYPRKFKQIFLRPLHAKEVVAERCRQRRIRRP